MNDVQQEKRWGGREIHLWETEKPLLLFHRTSCWSEGRERQIAGRSPSAIESPQEHVRYLV